MALTTESKEKVKKLIIEANDALEKHDYEITFQKCAQALIMDYDNPNIHLLLLLAEYKVTEIEDLKNCNVDFNSEKYKNVRRFANKELNDELNKYLSDKSSNDVEKPKIKTLLESLELTKSSINHSELLKKSIILFEEQIKALYGKYPNKYSTNNDYEIVTINPPSWRKETSFNINLEINIDSIGSATFYIKAILMTPIIIMLPFIVLSGIGNLDHFKTISSTIICTGFFTSLYFNYKKPIYFAIKKDTPIYLLLNSIFSLFLTIVSFILIYYLYFKSFDLLTFRPKYILATLIGIIPHFLMLFCHWHFCRFLIYVKNLWLALKKSRQ